MSTGTPLHGSGPRTARRPRPGAGVILQHLLAIALCVAALVATVRIFLDTSTGQWIDETALSEVSNELSRYSGTSIELLGSLPVLAGVLGAAGLLVAVLSRRRLGPALVGLLVALGANATTRLLKTVVLTKPDYGIQDALGNSMPSGHTTFAGAAGAALFLAAPKKWRPLVSLVMFFFTVATGVATVINAWHRPADVVAAIFVVSAWTALGLVLLRFVPSEDRDLTDTRHTGLLLIPLYTIMGLFMAFCAVVTYVVAVNQHLAGAALLGSLCMISAVGLLCTSVLVSLLRLPSRTRAGTPPLGRNGP